MYQIKEKKIQNLVFYEQEQQNFFFIKSKSLKAKLNIYFFLLKKYSQTIRAISSFFFLLPELYTTDHNMQLIIRFI